ncbi:hypothetical protein BV898_10550 [Hypsibius exemplaris]|uniref:Uncharacterized protein n=1 Tax=Hypsibius exemplaris TaxID=2072580 RepID=A0A1W0WJD7_HYPEX|nr:hypothetical protein BV898_10550 [Hypsibius exemplaris]
MHPGTVSPFNPGAVSPFNPGTVSPFNPGTVSPFNPRTVSPFNPGAVSPFTISLSTAWNNTSNKQSSQPGIIKKYPAQRFEFPSPFPSSFST